MPETKNLKYSLEDCHIVMNIKGERYEENSFPDWFNKIIGFQPK